MWLLAASAGVFLIHLTTVENYPPTWYDEICMIEWGRFSLYDVFPRWGVDMWTDSNRLHPPYPFFHYLAGAVYEGLYLLTSHYLAARILALASILVLPLLLFNWLATTFKVSPAFAFLIAALALVDPNITICAHWYRPDIWSICIFLSACAVLGKFRHPITAAAFVGFMIAFNTAFWITSVLFTPLYLYAYYDYLKCRGLKPKDVWIKSSLACCTGGLVAVALVLSPHYRILPLIVDQYVNRSELGGMANAASVLSAVPSRIFDFIKIALRSPFSWALAATGFFCSRKLTVVKLSFIGLVVLMLTTRVYHLRMIYLVPYLYALIAVGVTSLAAAFGERLTSLALSFSIFCCFTLSAPLLNLAARSHSNTFEAFKAKLDLALGSIRGDVYIFDSEHECYFALRETGRNPVSGSSRNIIFDYERSSRLIDSVNAVVVAKTTPLAPEQLEFLAKHDFAESADFDLAPDTSPGLLQYVRTAIYAHGFPGCTIYTRQSSAHEDHSSSKMVSQPVHRELP